MKIALIVAMSSNHVIGINNKLPWHLPADLKHFKSITWGKPIIMGRKTYESIGKPLPGRKNIVITQQTNLTIADCEVVHTIDEALTICKHVEEVMIIGGANIFQQTFPIANRLYLTMIHQTISGDSFFPQWNPNEWQEIQREDFQADDKNAYAYSFITLERTT